MDGALLSKACALAFAHAGVCYQRIRTPSELQGSVFAKPPLALNVDPLGAHAPSKTASWDRGVGSCRVLPPYPHATKPPSLKTLTFNPKEGRVRSSAPRHSEDTDPPKVCCQAPLFLYEACVSVQNVINQATTSLTRRVPHEPEPIP